MHESYNDMILAETSKIALPSRRNANFQAIEDPPKLTNQQNIDEKSSVFWDIDFGRILGSFWEGFGRSKSSIFAVFSMLFRYKIWNAFWKAKNREKIRSKDVPCRF